LVNFMEKNREFVLKLFETISPTLPEIIEVKENKFKDKKIVLTGTMERGRDEMKKKLEEMGAKISSSVSKNTDYLIYGEKAGSKLKKAQDLGVECLEATSIL